MYITLDLNKKISRYIDCYATGPYTADRLVRELLNLGFQEKCAQVVIENKPRRNGDGFRLRQKRVTEDHVDRRVNAFLARHGWRRRPNNVESSCEYPYFDRQIFLQCFKSRRDSCLLHTPHPWIQGNFRQRLFSSAQRHINFEDFKSNVLSYIYQPNLRLPGYGTCIPDFVLYANGIPIIVIEKKHPKFDTFHPKHVDQLQRYLNRIPTSLYGILYSETALSGMTSRASRRELDITLDQFFSKIHKDLQAIYAATF